MKQGFSLIEISIGLFLSSLIGTALYNAFFVTNRVVLIADNFIATDIRAALVENQFDKDFAGIVIPDETDLAQTATKKKPTPGKEEKKQSEPKPEPKNEAGKKTKPTEKIFYAENGAEDALQLLTFITNNPIKAYEKAANVKPKSRIVRVVYRLVPDEEEPKLLSLMRQESSELDLKAFDPKSAKPIRGFELAHGVKSIKCEYLYPVKKEENQQAQKDSKGKEEKPKSEYKTVKVWDVDTKKDEKQEQPKIPEFIRCTCEFWDTQQREESFTFNFQILTFNAQTASKKKQKQPVKQKEEASKPPADQKQQSNKEVEKSKPSLPGLG